MAQNPNPGSEPQPENAATPASIPARKKPDIGAVLVLLAVLGFVAENAVLLNYYQPWKHGLPGRRGEPAACCINEELLRKVEEAKTPPGPQAALPLANFMVNLADAGKPRYAKATVILGFEKADAPGIVTADAILMASTRQAVLEILGRRSAAEAVTVHGKEEIRQELLQKLNQLKFPSKIADVYLTEFLVQF